MFNKVETTKAMIATLAAFAARHVALGVNAIMFRNHHAIQCYFGTAPCIIGMPLRDIEAHHTVH